MKTFLSRRRYELLALSIALVSSAVHLWSDGQPATGLIQASGEHSAGGGSMVLRGIQLAEGRTTDLKFRARGARKPHPDVVVVAIDEKATQRYGLWPWSRARIAEAIRALHGAGAKAIGLDIAFTDEANDSSTVAYRQMLEQFDQAVQGARPDVGEQLASFRQALASQSSASPDLELAEALASAPEVIQGVICYTEADQPLFEAGKLKEHLELLEKQVIKRVPGNIPGSVFELPMEELRGWRQYSAQTPLPLFARTGTRFGHFNMVPDTDGTLRRTPVFAKLTGAQGFLPSLGLQSAATYFGTQAEPAYENGKVHGARLRREGQAPIFIAGEPFTLINYVGAADVFPTISIADVIDGTLEASSVRGKVVLVGMTTVGAGSDQRVMPFKESEPGVYSHASLVSSILSNEFLIRPDWLVLLECLLMIGLGLGLARLIPRVKAFTLKAAIIAGVTLAYLAVDQLLFSQGLMLATVLPGASVVATSFGLIFLGYLSVDREKLQLRSTFSKYLGEDVMEEALKHPEKLAQGEKREMTVLFSDIRGFTTLSERMVPEKLAKFIKDYLTPMTQIVFEEKGTLDKYIGDAVMAFWNAPLDQADHALRACRAAVSFLKKLEELKLKWRAENLPEFDIGVGINSGPMIVGNMGSDVRVDYTVMGDAVNLASRLEGTNKEYETRIILSENTYNLVKDQVSARRLGAVRVKGKRKPVRIYELREIGLPTGKEAEAIALFEAGVDLYVEQKWDESAKRFQDVLEIWSGDAPCRRYLDEIMLLKLQPPAAGWDGVYTATTK